MPCPWATEQPWAFSVGFAGAQRRQEPSTAESHRCLLSRVCRLHKPPSRRRLHLGLHLRPSRFQVSKAPVPRRKKPFRHAAWERAGSSLVCTPHAQLLLVVPDFYKQHTRGSKGRRDSAVLSSGRRCAPTNPTEESHGYSVAQGQGTWTPHRTRLNSNSN